MTIQGIFKDINNETVRVVIVNGSITDADVEIGSDGLFFSGDPIQISTDIDSSFEHVIRKSATINLVTDSYVGNWFFADNARSVTVRITRGNEVIFSGYLEPNTFSQGYSLPLEEFTLNCTDYLSTLQYLNYAGATADNYRTLKSQAANRSFKSILDEMFGESEIWYDLSKGRQQGSEASVFSELGVNENYIYGDEFDDVMTQQDILEEMLRYLNLHIVQEGDKFYIFDWDTVRNERQQWYELSSGETLTEPVQHIRLLSTHHADNATNITVADVYNQVQVTCELENEETVIESPLDTESLDSYYAQKSHYMTEYMSDNREGFIAMVKGEETSEQSNKAVEWYVQPMYNLNWRLYNNGGTADDLVTYDAQGEAIDAWRVPYFGKNNQITPLLLSFGSVERLTSKDNSPIATIQMKDYLVVSINGNADNTESGASPTEGKLQNAQPIVEFVGSNGGGVYSPSDDETTNYLVFSGRMTLQPIQWESEHYTNIISGHVSNDPFTDSIDMSGLYPVFPNRVPVDGGEKFYTRKFYRNTYARQTNDVVLDAVSMMPPVKGMKFRFEGDKYGSSDFKFNYSSVGDGSDKVSKLPILECELIIGSKRLVEYDMDELGNSKFMWTDIDGGVTESYVDTDGQTKTYLKQTFSLGVNPKIDDVILGTEFDLQNTIDYRMNIDAEGTAIPIRKSDGLSGAVIFRILGPINLVWNDITRRHPSFWRHTKWYDTNKIILAHLENIILSDFTAKIYTDGAGASSLSTDSDLIYLSNENHRYYSRKDDIRFRLITQLTSREAIEKGISPSICINSVIDMTSGVPINSLYNAATDETAKAEEHYVDQYYREYSRPRVQMETKLHDGSDVGFRNIFISTPLSRTFHVQGISRDVRMATATITLKEI